MKDLIKEAVPTVKVVALDALSNSNRGKVSVKALRALFKVVIDDTLYEISSTKDYVKHLKQELSRLVQISEFDAQRIKKKSPKAKQFYENGMKVLFAHNENMDNYKEVLEDYKKAIDNRNKLIDDLYKEIKLIKKLKC